LFLVSLSPPPFLLSFGTLSHQEVRLSWLIPTHERWLLINLQSGPHLKTGSVCSFYIVNSNVYAGNHLPAYHWLHFKINETLMLYLVLEFLHESILPEILHKCVTLEPGWSTVFPVVTLSIVLTIFKYVEFQIFALAILEFCFYFVVDKHQKLHKNCKRKEWYIKTQSLYFWKWAYFSFIFDE
jgi:hypothetical protein